jgi:hypothetical protein
MTAPAFTKFDPRAFLKNENRRTAAAKPAKAAKAPEREPERSATLATLATLAGGRAEIQNFEPEPDTWTEAEEERAAIVEYDGGAPRAWAEALARLDPSNPPGDVPPRRWLRFIDDCGRFLDGGWAARAVSFGWGPLDLFGCDRERPFARIDRLGLLWLLSGGAVVELHRDRAVIQVEAGARQCYRRRPVEVGRVVLAWDLTSSRVAAARADALPDKQVKSD